MRVLHRCVAGGRGSLDEKMRELEARANDDVYVYSLHYNATEVHTHIIVYIAV